MSGLLFSFFRALSRFSDLSLKDKLLRVVAWPYFLVVSLVSPSGDAPTSPYTTLYDLPAREGAF
jgi:hypothetical protein